VHNIFEVFWPKVVKKKPGRGCVGYRQAKKGAGAGNLFFFSFDRGSNKRGNQREVGNSGILKIYPSKNKYKTHNIKQGGGQVKGSALRQNRGGKEGQGIRGRLQDCNPGRSEWATSREGGRLKE